VNVPHTIVIRNVPDRSYRTLKARAAEASMSLSEYLLRDLAELTAKTNLADMRHRLRDRKPLKVRINSARLIREGTRELI
jgi:plasmid stability protein